MPEYGGQLTRAQVQRLLRAVDETKVERKQGNTYLPQHWARAELATIFGPGNADHTMTRPELIYETRLEKGDPQYPDKADGKKPYWVTAYMVGCTLRVRDYQGRPVYECTEWHAEENAPLPNRGEAHAMAITSAQSYALRRALISLGDAFGLHLYDGGSMRPIIGRTYLLEDKDSPLWKEPEPASAAADGQATDATARLQAAVHTKDTP